jgi:hypothetical protein
MRFLFILVMTGLFSVASAPIGAKAQPSGKIHGIWHNHQFGYQMTLILQPDGNGEFDGEPIRFAVQGNKLTVMTHGESTVYTFALAVNTLTLSDGDLDGPIAFTRSGTEVKTEPRNQVTPESTTSTSTSGLVGIWSGNGETIEFRKDGTCMYLGNTLSYEASRESVVITLPQGQARFTYVIQNNQLTLSANGQNVVYQRGLTKGKEPNTTMPGNGSAELAGKWCFVNVTSTNSGGSSADECITLHANGTYEYYSESSMSVNTNDFAGGTNSQSSNKGTWRVQGDRIYYNSQTQGQGSYQLQKINHPRTGDPMIVLDGKSYVTQVQRAPW